MWKGLIAATALAVTFGSHAAAQTAADTTLASASRLFHPSDLLVAGTFGVATIVMFPLDRHLASEVRREDYLGSRDLQRLAPVFRFLGWPGPLVIGSGAFAVGRVTRHRNLSEIALHSIEAVGVATSSTFVLKGLIGRERPYVSADTNAHRFRPFHGWSDRNLTSFPSGHTTSAFAVAAALTSEVQEKWPRATRIVAPTAYVLATGVGLSRMYEDKHWASDVVMGAAIGVFAGMKTVRFNHTRAGNVVDRLLLGEDSKLTVSPLPSGLLLQVRW